MSVDTIANMLSTIKNAYSVGKEFIEVPYSRENEEIAKIFKNHGFIGDIKVFKDKERSHKGLHLDLSYENGRPAITDAKRLSRPGRRKYRGADELRPVKSGYGLLVVSTSRGIMSGEEARKKRLGGELICKVW